MSANVDKGKSVVKSEDSETFPKQNEFFSLTFLTAVYDGGVPKVTIIQETYAVVPEPSTIISSAIALSTLGAALLVKRRPKRMNRKTSCQQTVTK